VVIQNIGNSAAGLQPAAYVSAAVGIHRIRRRTHLRRRLGFNQRRILLP